MKHPTISKINITLIYMKFSYSSTSNFPIPLPHDSYKLCKKFVLNVAINVANFM